MPGRLRPFRWILDDTRALVADLRLMGRRLSTRWQWMRLKSRRRAQDAAAGFENVRRSAGARTRMCSACRALIPIDARTCPECGETPGRAVPHGMARVVEHMIPGVVSVTSLLLTANIALYALSLLLSSRIAEGIYPPQVRDGAWNVALILLGANVPALTIGGDWWRLVTYNFLHGGLMHIVFNSYALLTVGPLLDEMYGPARYTLIYLVTGVCGGLASAIWRAGSWGPGIGASGAIFGLIGVAAVWGWRRGGAVGAGIRGQMVQWALYGLIMGVMFHFDNAAHLGGLISGGLLGLVLDDAQTARRGAGPLFKALAVLAVLLVAGSFLMVGLRYQETLRLIVEAY